MRSCFLIPFGSYAEKRLRYIDWLPPLVIRGKGDQICVTLDNAKPGDLHREGEGQGGEGLVPTDKVLERDVHRMIPLCCDGNETRRHSVTGV